MAKITRNKTVEMEWKRDTTIATIERFNLNKFYSAGDTLAGTFTVGEVPNPSDPTKTIKGILFDDGKKVISASTLSFARPLFKKKLLSNEDGAILETSEFTGNRIPCGDLGKKFAELLKTSTSVYETCCALADFLNTGNGVKLSVDLFSYPDDTYFKTRKGELSNGIEFLEFNFVK